MYGDWSCAPRERARLDATNQPATAPAPSPAPVRGGVGGRRRPRRRGVGGVDAQCGPERRSRGVGCRQGADADGDAMRCGAMRRSVARATFAIFLALAPYGKYLRRGSFWRRGAHIQGKGSAPPALWPFHKGISSARPAPRVAYLARGAASPLCARGSGIRIRIRLRLRIARAPRARLQQRRAFVPRARLPGQHREGSVAVAAVGGAVWGEGRGLTASRAGRRATSAPAGGDTCSGPAPRQPWGARGGARAKGWRPALWLRRPRGWLPCC
eukprot:scaffold28_cov515-Prasinococcus_capsulatus_cf.AAC.6